MTDDEPHADAHPILTAVDALAPTFAQAGLDELEVEVGDLRVRLARPRPEAPATGSIAPVAPAGVPSPAPGAGEGVTPFDEPAAGSRHVTAPLTGVWYGSPSPGARAYVSEGDEVAAGQVVGLIEAMKLFNEIKSDLTGTVTRVLVENGTLVKRRQPLLEVTPA